MVKTDEDEEYFDVRELIEKEKESENISKARMMMNF